jgi:ABC-type Zn2+ transport system substrate-binding protein/surface adhesin
MTTNRFVKLSRYLAAVGAAFAFTHCAHAALDVFACELEWAALSKELGGAKVPVYQATTAMQGPHRIEERPSLIAHTRAAELLVCTGADLEVGWLPVLLQTSGNAKVQVGQPGYFMVSDFVAKLEVPKAVDHSQDDIHPYGNPHVLLDRRNIARVAQELSQRLTQIDPRNAAYYAARLPATVVRSRQREGAAGSRGKKGFWIFYTSLDYTRRVSTPSLGEISHSDCCTSQIERNNLYRSVYCHNALQPVVRWESSSFGINFALG